LKTYKHIKKLLALFIIVTFSCSQKNTETINFREKNNPASNYELIYESGNWDHPNYTKAFKSYGNHRVVIQTTDPSNNITQAIIPWRRRDNQPNEKDIIIVDTKSNTVINKKYVIESNNEFGHLIFKPNKGSNTYYVYFLPHSSTGGYYPKLTYNKPKESLDKSWLSEVKLNLETVSNIAKAKIISMQAIDDFHSFYPMEVIATKKEVSKFINNFPKDYYLFPEYRENPIKMVDFLPFRWISETKKINGISDNVFKGEFYSFQIGIFSPNKRLEDIDINFLDFKSKNGYKIKKEMITCFNKGGIDLNGKEFSKTISVNSGKTQALWFGIEIPENTKKGSYMSQIIINPKNFTADTIFIELNVSDKGIANYGDDNPKNMSRMRWLNSTIGTGKDFIIKPFTPVSVSNNIISILGRDIKLNNFGFPENIFSYFTEEMTKLKEEKEGILAHPIKFDIIRKNNLKVEWKTNSYKINQTHKSSTYWESTNISNDFTMNISGVLEYDGMLDYKINIIANKDVNIKDIKLLIPMEKEAAKYILGLGLKGGKFKENITWKWDVTKHQEGAWLGNINKGIQYVLRDETYERPLNTNFYQAKPLNLPNSWYNNKKGGINITSENGIVNIENYSGERSMKEGETLNFNIRFLITPFKTIDTKEHFNTRFVHKYVPVDSVIKFNGTIVNVHHANEINPYINYPFYNIEKQKAYIEEAHGKGIRVKLYNTIRELSYKAHELFALKSLGDEILNDGKGGGHSWLQEHFKSNYHSAWHATEVNDAAILNKGTSRWTNYYIEGINWLAKNNKIDGLYLDDIAFSRATVKRIANVFNKHRDSFVIDLHSANQYNHRDGFINSAFLYMEHFPYISRLWFGEYFQYDLEPDYWLTEVSGIPFGLTGEMLEKGGRPYHGLIYGMTTRVYHIYNPGAIWNLFKEFDIENSEMLGYWVEKSPIKIDNNKIKSTIYKHNDKVLIVIGSWSNKDENIELIIDWKELGINKEKAHLRSPNIGGLQNYNTFEIDKAIPINRNSGLILILD
jgi:hypothetical protein